MPRTTSSAAPRPAEAGFTLAEVMVSVLVLSFGLMAIANLFAMATSSNVAARHLTASATQATEVMEAIKAVRFDGVDPGGVADLLGALDTQAASNHRWAADKPIRPDSDANGEIDAYEADRVVEGVGTIRVRWQIVRIDDQTRMVRVAAASASPLLRARSRIEMVTFRSCTGPRLGCPASPGL